jgi:release factor glutamine methyltransferase
MVAIPRSRAEANDRVRPIPRSDTNSIVGHLRFNGLILRTAPGSVMTPRSTSEKLVAAACDWIGGGRVRVADVGTGSGAIAIAIATTSPGATVWATDRSPLAVALARANVRRHRLETRIHVRHGDLLDPIPGPLDLIVANLPYLPLSAASKHPEIRDEPMAAVFAAGDGLDPYRRLVDHARARLSADGALAIQLHGYPVVATRAELPILRAALDEPEHGAGLFTASAAEAIAREAA